MPPAVDFVVPLYNAEKYIAEVLHAILAQMYDGVFRVVVVDDGSTDQSVAIVDSIAQKCSGAISLLRLTHAGAVAATNAGILATSAEFVCLIDSDVVLSPDWLAKVLPCFDEPLIAAVQGYYATPTGASFWAKVMGYDVEARSDAIQGDRTSQVCTGNTAYRRSALDSVGLFDPVFVYGYDNDMSYRLQKAGFALVLKKDARCDHYWKDRFSQYCRQQYWSAYGRMQLVSKHRERMSGDSVSGLRMILQAPATILCVVLLLMAIIAMPVTKYAFAPLMAAAGLGLIVVVDRALFAGTVYRKQRWVGTLLMPFAHMIRNTVWAWALLRWCIDRLVLSAKGGVQIPGHTRRGGDLV